MASHLDLEEQEQLDQLKAFWKQYGNLISWVLIVALGGYAAWNGWNWYQRQQGMKAGALYDELDRAALAGDAERTTRVFADMKDRYPRAAFTDQAGLVAARVAAEKGQRDAAKSSLLWVGEHAGTAELRAIARLRLAGLELDDKRYDEAIRQLDAIDVPEFAGLAADRRGDVLLAQGNKDAAVAAWQKALGAIEPKVDYRQLIEAKVTFHAGGGTGTAATAGAATAASAAASAVAASTSASAPGLAASR